MREVIHDIVRHTGGLGFIDIIKITGTETETKIEGMDSDKLVFVRATLTEPLPELKGEFGIQQMGFLNGLLNFVNYKTEGADFFVKQQKRNGKEFPVGFVFRDDNKKDANYRLMNPDLVPEQAQVANIIWDVTLEPNRAKVQEFGQLAALFAEFEKFFSVRTDNGDLVFMIGTEDSSEHNVSMVFEKGIKGELKGDLNWPSQQVLTILKHTFSSNSPVTMSFSIRGALQITTDSGYGKYNYILPARRR